jgi:DNA-3-methyladenine glycosylase II
MTESEPFELPAIAPFDLGQTVEALRRRPHSLTDYTVDSEYRRVLPLSAGERVICVRQIAADRVAVRALDGPLSGDERTRAAALVTRILGLSVDLGPLAALARDDEQIHALYQGLAGLKPPRYPSLWVTFASVVPYQQVSLESAIAVMNRIIAALGTTHEVEGSVYFGFPSAETFLGADPDLLRRCGLSTAKVRTLTSLAERVTRGELIEAQIEPLPDDEAVQQLSALPGIGPWSAQIVLLRGFRRLSVFPAGDAGANRNLRLFLDIPPEDLPRAVAALLAKLGPYQGYLYFMLLGRNLLSRGLIPPSPIP